MTCAARRPARPAALRSLLLAALLPACGGADEQPGNSADDERARPPAADQHVRAPAADQHVSAPADGEHVRAPADDEHSRAAMDVIAFLRGEREFAGIPSADTVVLYMAPEGGDARTILPRAALADRGNWQLSEAGHSYPLTPPLHVDSLTLFADSHANCWPRPLAERLPELARLPHVGAVLRPRAYDSCLQTWNLTLVFEVDTSPPRLVAVVYDQWEW